MALITERMDQLKAGDAGIGAGVGHTMFEMPVFHLSGVSEKAFGYGSLEFMQRLAGAVNGGVTSIQIALRARRLDEITRSVHAGGQKKGRSLGALQC